jgi:hypothetical protein
LFPADLREWLPEDHLVHFIIEAVEQRNVSAFTVFGIIKQAMGFRQFLLRGLEKVNQE